MLEFKQEDLEKMKDIKYDEQGNIVSFSFRMEGEHYIEYSIGYEKDENGNNYISNIGTTPCKQEGDFAYWGWANQYDKNGNVIEFIGFD